MAGDSPVVGKVSIKVWPDAKGFRQLLKREVEQKSRGVRAQVGLDLDDKGVRQEAQVARKKIEAELRDVKVGVDLEDHTAGQLALLDKKLKIVPELDTSKLQQLALFEDGDFTVKPALDRQALRRVRDALDDLVKKREAEIKAETGKAAIALVRAELARLARTRVVQLVPTVSKVAAARAAATLSALSGARVLNKYWTGLTETLGDFDKHIPKLATWKLVLSTLGSYALTAASNIFTLGSSIVQIGQASAALPGILGGMLVGVVATVIAFKDFKKVLPDVVSKFGELRQSLSDNFWAKAETPIRNMANKLFPEFEDGINRTSTALGSFFGQFANGLSSSFSGKLTGMFDNLERSINIASRSTGAMAHIIEILGTKGSERLPQLAGWFNKITFQFEGFLSRAEKDGSFDHWINNGVFQLQELGRSLRGAGSILAGIARAAEKAGGSNLTMFADTMERVAKAVNSKGFQDGLVSALEGAHKAMSNISSKSGASFQSFITHLSKSLGTSLPLAGDAAGTALNAIFHGLDQPAVMAGTIRFIKGVKDGLDALSPSTVPIGKALGGLASLAGEMARNLGKVAGAAITPLATGVARLAPALEPVVALLGDGLSSVLTSLSPVVNAVVDSIIKIADSSKSSLPQLVDSVKGVAANLGPKLANAIRKVGDFLANVIPPATRLGSRVLPVLGFALGLVVDALSLVASIASKIPGSLLVTVGAFYGLSRAISAVTTLGPRIVSAFETARLQAMYAGDAAQAMGVKMLAARAGAAALGVGLLTLGSHATESNTSLNTLVNVGGGALLGFAAGGPIGAAIGAGAGLLSVLATNSNKAKEAQAQLKQQSDQLRDSLDQTSGAITKQTREIVAKSLADQGVADIASRIGVALTDVTNAALGNKDAIGTVQQAINDYLTKVGTTPQAFESASKGLSPLTGAINGLNTQVTDGKQKIADFNAFLGTTKEGLNVPLAPKLDATALDLAKAKAQALGFDFQALANANISPSVILSSSQAEIKLAFLLATGGRLGQSKWIAQAGLTGAPSVTGQLAQIDSKGRSVAGQTYKPKVQLEPGMFNGVVRSLTSTLPGAMRTGGAGVTREAKSMSTGAQSAAEPMVGKFGDIGSNAGNALADGLRSAIGPATDAADELAHQAERAAEARAKIQSPSRVWIGIGKYMGAGLAIGLDRSQATTASSATALMDNVINAVPGRDFMAAGGSAIASLVTGMESKYATVKKSLQGLATDVSEVEFAIAPTIATRSVSVAANGALAPTGTDGTAAQVLNYYAAPTSQQIPSDEALFEAGNRARMMFSGTP